MTEFKAAECWTHEPPSIWVAVACSMNLALDWAHTGHLYRNGQSRLYFLGMLWSFNNCRKLLWMFSQSGVATVLFYTVVWLQGWTNWSGGPALWSAWSWINCWTLWTMPVTLCTLASTTRACLIDCSFPSAGLTDGHQMVQLIMGVGVTRGQRMGRSSHHHNLKIASNWLYSIFYC